MKYFSERSALGRRFGARAIRSSIYAASAALGVASCATYDGTRTPQASDPTDLGGAGGTDAGASGGAIGNAGQSQTGGSDSAGSGGASDGDAGRGGNSAGEAGEGGAPISAGNSGDGAGAGGRPNTAGGGGASGGGASGGGASGAATGGASAAGMAGLAGAGGTPAVSLLSQGKTATADSTQTTNVASLANDGSIVTRWCAANGDPNHYWQVDLGVSRTLSRIDIAWEKSANYKFKIEGSSDGSTWAMLVDKQTTTASTSAQSYTLATPKARFVKVTVTGLPSSSTWASFYEFQVFGY